MPSKIKSVVLPHESAEDFQLLIDSYKDQFQPGTALEMEFVEAMAVARWRLRRICTIETTLLADETTRRAEDIDEYRPGYDGDQRLAWIFQRLADHGQSLALIARYEGALNRSHDRAFKQLQILQAMRNRPQRNEPKPAPDHPSCNVRQASGLRRVPNPPPPNDHKSSIPAPRAQQRGSDQRPNPAPS